MHGKKEKVECNIRKGPWKEEEDKVLIEHVRKYGPRDWSSIRSNGLLLRTGKSCRLRWVNKLRPNLKNGVKFTAEEERVVIEMQGQIGNKWAKIASYLTGRTDNDVKNFWSSRQKRLARILHHTSSSSTSTSTTTTASNKSSLKSKTNVPTVHDVPTLEAPKLSSSSEGEQSSKTQLCSSLSCIDNSEVIKMVSLPDLIKSSSSEINHLEQDYFITPPFESYNKITDEHISIPQIPEFQTNNDLTFSTMGSQDILNPRIDDPNFIDDFGPMDTFEFGFGLQQHSIEFPLSSEPSSLGNCRIGTGDIIGSSSKNCESFFDDFPVNMFDHMEPPKL